jgi:hypothetical protein
MTAPVVDIFMVYQFIKRLVTPFEKTKAYELGLIDANGKRLKKAETQEEKRAMGYFDRLVFNLKRLLAKVPGGQTILASYVAALLLLREQDEKLADDENYLEEQYRKQFDSADILSFRELQKIIDEDIANATGAGVVGTGDNQVHWSKRQPRLGVHGAPRKKYGQPLNALVMLRRKKIPEQKVYYKMLGRYVKPSKSSSSGGGNGNGE